MCFGRDTVYIHSKGFRLKAIDLSPALIKRAKERFPGGDFDIKDIRRTGFSDETFDGVWCNATLLHLNDEDMNQALREFHRILKPGGVLCASLKKGVGTKSLIDSFSSKSERFFNFKTQRDFRLQLEESGFEEAEAYYLNEQDRYGRENRDIDWLYSFSKRR